MQTWVARHIHAVHCATPLGFHVTLRRGRASGSSTTSRLNRACLGWAQTMGHMGRNANYTRYLCSFVAEQNNTRYRVL